MGDKSIRKKRLIVEKAREVFAKKGFLTVSMKDIVEACEISRGGLYLYFEDTEKVFLEVLEREKSRGEEADLEKADTAAAMLSMVLAEQKKELLSDSATLSAALYEYYFYKARQDGFLKDPVLTEEKGRFEMYVKVLQRLIRGGIREGYFDCEDPLAEANNIMIAIEGLKILKATVGISEKLVTDEINYLYSHLFVRQEAGGDEDAGKNDYDEEVEEVYEEDYDEDYEDDYEEDYEDDYEDDYEEEYEDDYEDEGSFEDEDSFEEEDSFEDEYEEEP